MSERPPWSDVDLLPSIVLLEDAFAFRSITHKLSPTKILRLYLWYWSKWFQGFLTGVVSCQLLLIFVQYPSSISRTSDLRQEIHRWTLPCFAQLFIEFLCLLIFYFDAVLRVRSTRTGSEERDELCVLGVLHRLEECPEKALDHRVFHCHHGLDDRFDSFCLLRMSSEGKTLVRGEARRQSSVASQMINVRYLLRPFYMPVISQEMKKIFNSVRKSFLQILRY